VGFEPSEDPSVVNMVLTVEEGGQQDRLLHRPRLPERLEAGASIPGYQLAGTGHEVLRGVRDGASGAVLGFYEQPFMDQETYAWKVGAYKRKWEEQDEYEKGQWKFQYDQEKTGAYVGVGKKFKGNDQLSWYLTLDWHKVENTILSGDVTPQDLVELEDGTNFSVTDPDRITLDIPL
jgi:outer membrane protein insertion porin family